jgi:RNA polymerase sigma-70 factor (ECF subfamily)
MQEQEVQELVGRLFRHESGKMAAVLTRILGVSSMELADDLVQDTLLQAMSVWKYKGIPENPSAWLYAIAKRKAIDTLRKQKVRREHQSALSAVLSSEWTLSSTVHQMFLENEIEDSQLRMIFACCHPSIPYDAQLALTLKTLCGLSIQEIAKSFLTNEETISKRIYRAREKIRSEKINLDSPPPSHLPERMDAVLHSLYLLFNEGYNSSYTEHLIRHDLCEEAMRLCILLTQHTLTNFPNTQALLSLMCLQASRSEARVQEDGGITLLKDQDRTKWITPLIEKGKYYLEKASDGEHLSEYHIEAAIAACHANAVSFEETD